MKVRGELKGGPPAVLRCPQCKQVFLCADFNGDKFCSPECRASAMREKAVTVETAPMPQDSQGKPMSRRRRSRAPKAVEGTGEEAGQ